MIDSMPRIRVHSAGESYSLGALALWARYKYWHGG